MHFVKSCRKNVQLKCVSTCSSHFCFIFLHINFGSCKEMWFEQLKDEDKRSVVGQVMAPEQSVCLLTH